MQVDFITPTTQIGIAVGGLVGLAIGLINLFFKSKKNKKQFEEQ